MQIRDILAYLMLATLGIVALIWAGLGLALLRELCTGLTARARGRYRQHPDAVALLGDNGRTPDEDLLTPDDWADIHRLLGRQ